MRRISASNVYRCIRSYSVPFVSLVHFRRARAPMKVHVTRRDGFSTSTREFVAFVYCGVIFTSPWFTAVDLIQKCSCAASLCHMCLVHFSRARVSMKVRVTRLESLSTSTREFVALEAAARVALIHHLLQVRETRTAEARVVGAKCLRNRGVTR